MGEMRECGLCGAVYSNADKHQRFHDEIDAWIQLIELEVVERLRLDRLQRQDGA